MILLSVYATFSVRYSYVYFLKLEKNTSTMRCGQNQTAVETKYVKLIYANLFKSEANVY